MLDFTKTGMDGSFRFKDVPYGNHLVKSTYIGFLPLTVDASSDGDNINLSILKMTEIAEELMEVVIKAAKAPMKMKGDTIEYDASTFKVPEGSTVEDLLRRLPGIEVESDGSIQADGKDVNRVTVDGKSFFGSDPKAATKNLPAEGISKVQVFDTKSEEEKTTGIKTETEEKTMNLELKDEFKSGGFGKIIAALGDQERKELKGNYNKFNDKIQFSLVGVGNNTGRNGLAWNDYQDFMGSGTFRFSQDDTYGFGGGGHNYYMFGGGGGGIEASISSMFFADGRSGLPENYSGGLNFNYDHKKTKVNTVYYYNQNGLLEQTVSNQDKFYQNFTQQETMASTADDVSRGHRVEVELEQELDSLHTIKIDLTTALINNNMDYSGSAALSSDEDLASRTTFNNQTKTTGELLSGSFIFRKKFQKKGRRLGANVSYLTTELEDDWTQGSNTDFFGDTGVEGMLIIDQDNNDIQSKNLFKSNAVYVEPLAKKFFLQTFYNHRNRREQGERAVYDLQGAESVLNNQLSRVYDNRISYNRIGSALRYSHDGVNISLGLGYQHFNLEGVTTALSDGANLGVVDADYQQYIPHLSLSFNPDRNTYISASYNRNADEPEIQDLQPIVDNLNPLFVKTGNPALLPALSNSISSSMRRRFPISDVSMNLFGSFTLYETQFSTNETVDDRLVTTYQPINIDGGNSMRYSARVSFPFIKNKFTARVRYSGNLGSRPSIVNSVENDTRTLVHSPSIRLSITPTEHFTLYIEGRFRHSDTSYEINQSQNQITKNTTLSVEFSSKIGPGLFISSNMEYDRFQNERFDLDRTIPIWNTSIYKHLLEGNKMEVRLSLYDGLNRNVGFDQRAYGIGVRQTSTETLARYAMLSLTYNLRGLKTDLRKNSWW